MDAAPVHGLDAARKRMNDVKEGDAGDFANLRAASSVWRCYYARISRDRKIMDSAATTLQCAWRKRLLLREYAVRDDSKHIGKGGQLHASRPHGAGIWYYR